jgi:hypothetical protein
MSTEIQVFWDEICALLGYYAASSVNPLPTFRDKGQEVLEFLDFLTFIDETETLSRNVGKILPLEAS